MVLSINLFVTSMVYQSFTRKTTVHFYFHMFVPLYPDPNFRFICKRILSKYNSDGEIGSVMNLMVLTISVYDRSMSPSSSIFCVGKECSLNLRPFLKTSLPFKHQWLLFIEYVQNSSINGFLVTTRTHFN